MLELALKSDNLLLACEDDTFALITAWAGGNKTVPGPVYGRLVSCLRLQHMSPTFLTTVVARSKYSTRLKPWQITDAMAHQGIAASLNIGGTSLRRTSTSICQTYKPSRAPKDPVAYLLEAEASLDDCTALEDGKSFCTMLGVAGGYRLSIGIFKRFAVRVVVYLNGPGAPCCDIKGLGPITRLKVCAGGEEHRLTTLLPVESSHAWDNFFRKPWEEVVCDGSPYFPQGRMPIKVTIQFPSDKQLQEAVVEELA
jgi:hypothetical protein